MKGITLRGLLAKLLPFSLFLSLVYVAVLPAQAQSSRSSSTNSAPGLRGTPTAVPSAMARSQKDQVYFNSCAAPSYESMSGIPYTGGCERKWINGEYTCRHYARDYCNAILPNGRNQEMGSGCWPLSIMVGQGISEILKPLGCLITACKYGLDKFLAGHAINVFRSGGKEVKERYNEVTFSVFDPQERDGSYVILCSWRQKSLKPEIPEDCKKEILAIYFPTQIACGIKYDFKVWEPDAFEAEVVRQDKEYGSGTSKP